MVTNGFLSDFRAFMYRVLHKRTQKLSTFSSQPAEKSDTPTLCTPLLKWLSLPISHYAHT
jgi:hypothetical protein